PRGRADDAVGGDGCGGGIAGGSGGAEGRGPDSGSRRGGGCYGGGVERCADGEESRGQDQVADLAGRGRAGDGGNPGGERQEDLQLVSDRGSGKRAVGDSESLV